MRRKVLPDHQTGSVVKCTSSYKSNYAEIPVANRATESTRLLNVPIYGEMLTERAIIQAIVYNLKTISIVEHNLGRSRKIKGTAEP